MIDQRAVTQGNDDAIRAKLRTIGLVVRFSVCMATPDCWRMAPLRAPACSRHAPQLPGKVQTHRRRR